MEAQVHSYRCEEHGEEVDHGLHVEAPLGSHAGCRQEHQAADCRKQHLGNKGTHGGGTAAQLKAVDTQMRRKSHRLQSVCSLQCMIISEFIKSDIS